MRLNIAIPEAHVQKPVLDSGLEAVTRLNESLIRGGELKPFNPHNPGVIWKPEPPGQEHFDHGRMVAGRGWGDCDDLAPWRAASLRVTGEDPGARAVVRRSGERRWHAVVRRSDGSIDDPSLAAGMPGRGRGTGVVGATLPLMVVGGHSVGAYFRRPQLALRPVRDRHGQIEAWQARADLPWHSARKKPSKTDIAMVSLHASPVSSQAIVGACHGAIALADAAGIGEEDHLDRLNAIADACDGADWEEIAGEYGPEHADAAAHIVGSFFGSIIKKATGAVRSAVKNPVKFAYRAATSSLPGPHRMVARAIEKPAVSFLSRNAVPIASRALQFIPGVGPLASMAFQQAAPMLQRMIARGGMQRPPQYAAPQQQYPPQYAAPQQQQYPPQYAAPPYGGQQWFPRSYAFG